MNQSPEFNPAARAPVQPAVFSRPIWQNQRFVIALLVGMVVPLGASCRFQSSRPHEDAGQSKHASTADGAESDPSAAEIVNKMCTAYAMARGYRDEAVLQLSYRLQGRFMDEPHMWQVHYRRPGKLKASVYNVRLTADGQQLSCFIYDFGSANLDDQWAFYPYSERLPIRKLFGDGICRYYLTGQTELPLNSQLPHAADEFFPPTIGLLTEQGKPPWLNPSIASRLGDETIDGHPCFQIQFLHQNLKYTVWIRKDGWLLSQILYPLQLLDSRLQGNEQVQNLQLVARFHKATVNPVETNESFAIEFPRRAKMVSHFVAVPEPFPSNTIGKPIPSLGLRNADGSVADQSVWKGKVTLLAWLTDSSGDQSLAQTISDIARELPRRDYHFAQVAVLAQGFPDDRPVIDYLASLAGGFSETIYADFRFAGGKAMGLKSHPVIAVVDRLGVLQFVKSIGPGTMTADEIKQVLFRVRSGADVAADMRRQYEKFLDDYHTRLAHARVGDGVRLVDDGSLVNTRQPAFVNLTSRWENTELSRPGNIESLDNGDLLVVDGWRTLVRVNRQGQIVQRRELDLDPQESINVLRSGPGPGSGHPFIVYSQMGRSVRVMDQQLRLLHRYQVAYSDPARIQDALLIAVFNAAGVDEAGSVDLLTLQNDGAAKLVQLPGGRAKVLEIDPLRCAMPLGTGAPESLLVCDRQGQAFRLELATAKLQPAASGLATVTSLHSGGEDQRVSYCIVGTDAQGGWMAHGLDRDLNPTWQTSIGSQRFDSQIQSVSYARNENTETGMWAIAGQDGSIMLVTEDGAMTDQWNVGQAIHGIEIMAWDGYYMVVLSTEKKIEAWSIAPKHPTARAPLPVVPQR